MPQTPTDPATASRPARTRKRGGSPRRLGGAVLRAALPLLARRGLAEEALLAHWPEIVGPALASRVYPQRLVRPRRAPKAPATDPIAGDTPSRTAAAEASAGAGATLHLRVESGAVALELAHRLPQLQERINRFLGHRAIGRLTLHQGRPLLPLRPRRAALPPLPADRRASLDRALATIPDPALRQALARLGEAVGRREAGRDQAAARRRGL